MTDNPDTGEDTEKTGFVRPFADILRAIQGGTVATEAAEGMQALVAAVKEHGGKGLLRLDIKIEPLKGNDMALAVSGEITIRAPRPAPAAAIFFSDKENNLSREDPRQQTIPGLRTVGGTVNPDNIKEINR